MTAILPALSVGMVAGQRKAFNPKKALAGPVAMAMALIILLLLAGLFLGSRMINGRHPPWSTSSPFR